MSEYTQAQNFLDKNGITFNAEFVKNDFHFEGDKDKRDIYKCTFTRKGKSFSLMFGQSIARSLQFKDKYTDRVYTPTGKSARQHNYKYLHPERFPQNKAQEISSEFRIIQGQKPTAYDVLACITKYDPIDFENFCSEYGYDTDSVSAKRTFEAVDKEYVQVVKFFSESEIEELQEIQ